LTYSNERIGVQSSDHAVRHFGDDISELRDKLYPSLLFDYRICENFGLQLNVCKFLYLGQYYS